MNSKMKLLKVARPQFLIGGLALFVLGTLWAVLLGADFSLVRFLLGYLGVVSCQLSVHFSNDYFDAGVDQPDGETFISGGSGVLNKYVELQEPAKWIAVGLIVFSLGMGAVLTWLFSYPVYMLVFVALGNLLGWCYSAPPFRLAYRGIGELCYAFVGGFLVPSMGYMVTRGKLDLYGIFFIIPLSIYGLATLICVEIPDFEDDRRANKRNLVARGGRRFAFRAIGLLLLLATAYFFIFPRFLSQHVPVDLRVFGSLSLLPLSIALWGIVRHPLERKPATKMAIGILVVLVFFAVLVDGYLFYLTRIS